MEVYLRMEHSDEKEQRQQKPTKEGKTAAVAVLAKLNDDPAPSATGIPVRKEQLQNGTVREDY